MLIQERSCPVCAVPRTFRLWGGRSLCANCKHQWPARFALSDLASRPEAWIKRTLPFSPAELVRLRVYRAAVAHRFYNEQLPPADRTSAGPLLRLPVANRIAGESS